MSEFSTQKIELPMDAPNEQRVFKNVKEMKIGDGKVRIKDGALIISDENGIDRVLIGYLKDGF